MAITAACGGVLGWQSDGSARPLVTLHLGARLAFAGVLFRLRRRDVEAVRRGAGCARGRSQIHQFELQSIDSGENR
jgi:hypothetical protein